MRAYAAPSYQLDRAINVFVLNNTYILNPTTVATFRFGMNTFDDDNSLPFDFDSHTLGWNPAFADAIPVQKFPSLTLSGAAATPARASAASTTAITTPGASTASLTKLAGSHSFKIGADYRILGVDALNLRAVGRQLHLQRHSSPATTPTTRARLSRNSIADLLLGYPSIGHASRSTAASTTS